MSLLQNGYNINAKDDEWTLLHWAAFRDNVEMARILLENGAQIDEINEFGHTPLHLAGYYGN